MNKIRGKVEKVKESQKGLKKQVKRDLAKYIGAGFGLVASLAWNDAIKALIALIFPLESNSIWAKFVYAIIMTMVVVIVSVYLLKKDDKKEKKEK